MKKTNNRCPKCNARLSPFYLKQTCPKCGVNLMYYRLDERLEEDAKNAAEEVRRVNEFTDMLRASTVKTPLHIIRLILFFTPLASMCLPMYWAGNKEVSLIGFILSIVNHGFDMSVWTKDYLFAVLAMIGVIVFSLAVIIGSLFSAKENGFRRNMALSILNTLVFGVLSVLVCINGGTIMPMDKLTFGFSITCLIYGLEFLFHYLTSDKKTARSRTISFLLTAGCVIAGFGAIISNITIGDTVYVYDYQPQNTKATSVVSFNVAAPWGTPFDGTKSADRCYRFTEYLDCEADLFGTQELNSAWYEKLIKVMPEYDSYAVKRGDDEDENRSEMNGVFWRKDRYTAIEKNTFWLSLTPEKESRFTYVDENGEQQEAGCNRICTYVILEEINGSLLAFLNTHLDNSSEEAMNYGAQLIVDKINEIKAQYAGIHIILTGDFNQTEDGAAYKTISAVLSDTTDKSKEKATWQDWGYTNTGDKPIDFIFTDGNAKNYEVLDDLTEGYVSDHYGIAAEIEW